MSLVSWETPWKPATIAIVAVGDARPRSGPGVMSMILALPWARVGDHAGLRAGERPRLVAELRDRHREQRHRDPLARGEQHVELARRRQRASPARRGRAARRWCRPSRRRRRRRRGPALRVATMRWATRLMPVGVGDRRAAVLLHDNAHWLRPRGSTAGQPPGCESSARPATAPGFYRAASGPSPSSISLAAATRSASRRCRRRAGRGRRPTAAR